MTDGKILFLKQEDAIASGVLDMKACVESVLCTLEMLGKNEIMNPPKTSLKHYREDGSMQFKLNSMPVYVGGNLQRAGVKWAGEAPGNSESPDLPLGIDVMILSDVDTVLPVAIMDATLITAMRTAAVTAIAIRLLSSELARTVGVFGAGVIGRTLLMALRDMPRVIEEVRLFDLQQAKAVALAEEFEVELPVRVVSNGEAACRGAKIVITATTAFQKIVEMDWLDVCVLRCQCGANEFPPESILEARRIVIDDWEQMIGVPGSNFKQLAEEGRIVPEDTILLSDIVAGNKKVETESENPIQFMARGLACLDLAFGEYVYQQARELGLGTVLNLWDEPVWI